ncbi:MAG: hypothetical protein GPJ18_00440 [Microcystis aeruginosa F13-15]|nr:hypothetical protein [Microcystis aeruginosa F13-15]
MLQKKSFFDKKQQVCRGSYGRVGSGEVDVGCGVWGDGVGEQGEKTDD